MWTCIKCNAVNEDIYTICPKCGASRSAGRFGSATPAKTVPYPAETKPQQPAEPAPAPEPTYVDIDESFGEEEETFVNIDNPNDTAIYRINRKGSGKK